MYKRQFEAAAEMNCWNKGEKAIAFMLELGEIALQLLQNITEHDQKNYWTIIDALELRYREKDRSRPIMVNTRQGTKTVIGKFDQLIAMFLEIKQRRKK